MGCGVLRKSCVRLLSKRIEAALTVQESYRNSVLFAACCSPCNGLLDLTTKGFLARISYSEGATFQTPMQRERCLPPEGLVP